MRKNSKGRGVQPPLVRVPGARVLGLTEDQINDWYLVVRGIRHYRLIEEEKNVETKISSSAGCQARS